MRTLRASGIGIELIRALAVLAVAFLCFAPHPAGAGAVGLPAADLLSGVSFCGEAPEDADGAPRQHRGCDACRIQGGLSAPCTPPSLAIPDRAPLAAGHRPPALAPRGDVFPPAAPPRGPPSA